jgi:hypothetical protein
MNTSAYHIIVNGAGRCYFDAGMAGVSSFVVIT